MGGQLLPSPKGSQKGRKMSTKSNASLIETSKIKLSKERFREEFYDIMAELLSDSELLVRIEVIDMYLEY
jgi:hypothetical protein